MEEHSTSLHQKYTADDETLASGLLVEIEALVAEMHPGKRRGKPVTLDSSLERELGLDSLARVELLARIEDRFGVSVPERVFADAETVRDLVRAVRGAGAGKVFSTVVEAASPSPGEAAAPPHGAQTLVDVLNWHAASQPDRTHIRLFHDEGEGELITYLGLKRDATAVAVGLQQRGMQTAEPVVIMLPTGADYFMAFFGVLLAGGIPVPIYPPARMSQIEDHLRRNSAIVGNCGAATLITFPEAKTVAHLLKSLAPCLRSVTTVAELAFEPGTYYEPAVVGGSTAFLQYTSGSTGNPKGVILTHDNLLANIRAMGEAMQVSSKDVFISWLPLYHDMGLIGAWLGSLYYAMQLVIMSPLEFITRPQRWLRAIHRFRGSLSASPNFGYDLCVKRIKDEDLSGLDLSSWRGAFNGAEPVSPATLERFCERFEQSGFRREALMPVYGLAESAVGLAFPPLGRGPMTDLIQREPFVRGGRAVPAGEGDSRTLSFAACGRPLPGHEVRIVDATGRELPDRHEGRLQFRGPSTTGGYFRNPEETKRLFDRDWLSSGDLAYIADGDIYLTGRTKDLIIRAGRNIYPQQLEEAVGDVPGIRKGCVVAFASQDPASATERLVLVAETSESDGEMLGSLRVRINELANDLLGMPPDDVVLTGPRTVLKTSSGKIRRSANRDLYERGWLGKAERPPWCQVARILAEGARPRARRIWMNVQAGLYAAYVWSLFGLAAPLTWLLIVALPRSSWCWAVARTAARFLAGASGVRISVQGLENLPSDAPCVLVSNHASYLDSLVLAAALPRPVSFVAKGELERKTSTRLPLNRLGVHFVERFDREKSIEDARRIGERRGEERPLVFFAEGTFTRVPGLLPFHMGAFLTAAEGGKAVVPIAIRGTRSILRSQSWFPRRGAIRISIGEAIDPREATAAASGNAWAIALELRERTRAFILSHCGEPDLIHEEWPNLRPVEDQDTPRGKS
ncbi:MAG: AMP-binding protein [Syntrophobacteraceae bacterium]